MADQFSTMDKIVAQVAAALVADDLLPEATSDTVIVSDDPRTSTATPQSTWFVVSPSPQEGYDQAAIDGGGINQLSVRTRIIVTINVAAEPLASTPDRLDSVLNVTGRSLQQLKRLVIKSLMYANFEDEDTGLEMLNDPMLPAEGNWSSGKGGSDFQVAFDIEYDEDLHRGLIMWILSGHGQGITQEECSFPCIMDTTGELNDHVWSSYGELRGLTARVQNSSGSRSQKSVARWPRTFAVPEHRPSNLRLNELYWPTLNQHCPELWIVIRKVSSSWDYSFDEIANLYAKRQVELTVAAGANGFFIKSAQIAGIWELVHDSGASSDLARAGIFNQLDHYLVCITDSRYCVRAPFCSSGFEPRTYPMAGSTAFPSHDEMRWEPFNTGPGFSLDSRTAFSNNVRPCPISASMEWPDSLQYIDAASIGLGCWPVRLPHTTRVSVIDQREYFAPSDIPSAVGGDSRSDRISTGDSPYSGVPWDKDSVISGGSYDSFGSLGKDDPYSTHDLTQEYGYKLNPSGLLSSEVTKVIGHVRADSYLMGTVELTSELNHPPTAATPYIDPIGVPYVPVYTALYRNYDKDGAPNGSIDYDTEIENFRLMISGYRHAALSRGSYTCVIDADDNRREIMFPEQNSVSEYFTTFTSGVKRKYFKRFPPSAMVFYPGSNTDSDGYSFTVREIGWTMDQMITEFPITWDPAVCGVPQAGDEGGPNGGPYYIIDSGMAGSVLELVWSESDGEWVDNIGRRVDWFGRWWQFQPSFPVYDGGTERLLGAGGWENDSFGPLPWCYDLGDICAADKTYTPARPTVIRTSTDSWNPYDVNCWALIAGVYKVEFDDGSYFTLDPGVGNPGDEPGNGFNPPEEPDTSGPIDPRKPGEIWATPYPPPWA